MKFLNLIWLCTLTMWAAEIDTGLYEGNNTTTYHQEISKLIAQEPSDSQEDKERIIAEQKMLEKLSKTLLKEPQKINAFPASLLPDDQNISKSNYFSFLNAITDTHTTLETLKDEKKRIHAKLLFLKDLILNTTTENKNNLLLNQLGFAYYKVKKNTLTADIVANQSLLEKEEATFVQKLKQVSFDTKSLEATLLEIDKKYSASLTLETSLNLSKERELMYHETPSESLTQKQLSNDIEKMRLLTDKINQTLLLSLAYVQKNETTAVLDLFSESKKDIQNLDEALQQHFSFKRSIVKSLLDKEVGTVSVALSDVEDGAKNIYKYTYDKLSEPLFVFNEHGISTIDIFQVILIFIIGFFLASFYKRKMIHFATNSQKLTLTSAKMISNFGYYLIVLVTLLVAMKSIGLDLSNLGLIAGALSIGIGFGLQTLVSNLAAGIILMFERTIRLGDYIELSDTLRGTVNDIKMRSTTVTTNDNIDVIVPNSFFVQNNVINWTLENDMRRIHIPFSIEKSTEIENTEYLILEALKHSSLDYFEQEPHYTSLVLMTAMGASSIDYELAVWVKGVSARRPASTKSDFLKFLYAILKEHHIELSSPQTDAKKKS